VWICTGNKLAKFQGNILSLSDNIAKSFRGGLLFFDSHCRKYSFCSQVINIWNSLPDHVVEADSINSFKSRLDKDWTNQDVIYNYDCDLTGTGGLPVCM